MTHAERELKILEEQVPDALILSFKKEIIALYNAFMHSGQSGGSAPYTAKAISQAVEKLMLFKTLSPLTGEDYEWNDVSAANEAPMYQNNRNSGVFKEEGGACFVDAIVFDGDIGGRFTGNGSVTYNGVTISSSQRIKKFPFTPKTFFVDVVDHRWKDKEETTPDENGHWWTHTIKNPEQLKEVFEYYENPGIIL